MQPHEEVEQYLDVGCYLGASACHFVPLAAGVDAPPVEAEPVPAFGIRSLGSGAHHPVGPAKDSRVEPYEQELHSIVGPLRDQ